MKIFDSVIFFNELDLLEIRLNVLNDFVDYFVITESPWTVSGNSKPLFYLENKERFSKFNHKIIHIFNRDSSIYGAIKGGINNEDIIITSDVDEVPNPLIFENLDWFDKNNHYVCLQRAFYYKLNYLYQENWMGSRICSFEKLSESSVDMLRNNHKDSYKIEDGGWHWSFFGDADNFRAKLSAYEHTENNTEEITSTAEKKIEEGIDPFGRPIQITTVPIDSSYPEYIINNQEKYSNFIKPWN